MDEARFKSAIRDVLDFPEPGIVFKDITPLLGHPAIFAEAVDALAAGYEDAGITKVVGIEARGFIFAAPVAMRLEAGFVPIRKPGKLPSETHEQEYELEYGTDRIEVHRDAFEPGDKILLVDDVLATGGTGAAAIELMRGLGGDVVGFCVLVELDFLGGRSRLGSVEVRALVHYDNP